MIDADQYGTPGDITFKTPFVPELNEFYGRNFYHDYDAARSQIRTSGTLVAMGLNSPRTSAGAAGFRSHVSCWAGPPHMKSRMHAFARGRDAGSNALRACNSCGRPNPRRPSEPARRNSRRPIGAALKKPGQAVCCMRSPLVTVIMAAYQPLAEENQLSQGTQR